MTHLFRLPYMYMANTQLVAMHVVVCRYLSIIYDIHNDIPNQHFAIKPVKKYWYHPKYLIWCH